jgi:CelD/BcsL family acetyltransferase involved in cellulose biosynthesis
MFCHNPPKYVRQSAGAQLEMCSLAISEIETAEELVSLRSEWLALWRRSSAATPFQSPDWLIPWWKYFGAGRLCVLVLTEDTRLVGIAPLFANGERRLRLLGAGNSDYLDVLFDDRIGRAGAAAIFSYLAKTDRWDQIDLQNLQRHSPLLATNTWPAYFEHVEEQDTCPVVSLPQTADQFLNSLPRQLRHNLNYYHRKLDAFKDVKIERANEDNFPELFDAFVSLHEARWQMKNMPGVLCGENLRHFHHEAGAGFLSNGALRLYALRVDRHVVACLYAFHHARRTYYYLSGFDPEFKQYSPGTILVAHAIAEATHERAKEFDFLRGREPYKYKWGAVDRSIYRKQLEPIRE